MKKKKLCIICIFLSSSQMDAEKMFTASGSADTKLSAGILKHEDMKQENFHGWDAAE